MAEYVEWMRELVAQWGLWGIAFSGFLSSTVLPGTSEVLLTAYVAAIPNQAMPAFVVATLANTAGAMTTWWIGRLFPRTERLDERARQRVERYGVWALLFTWVPVVGDGLSLAAGWLRLPFLPSLLLTFVGKGGRYALLLGILDVILSN